MTVHRRISWTGILLLAVFLLMSAVLAACGREAVTEGLPDNNPGEQTPVADPMETESMDAAEPGDPDAAEPGDQNGAEPEDAEPATDDSMRLHEIREMFGEDCIAERTYEVELSEYDGKVWFVPFAPSKENPEFSMQIIQNGEVLRNIRSFPIDTVGGRSFTSLDAVYFGDLNYDGCTDILLIETYGNMQIPDVKYGFDANASEYDRYFHSQSRLCENIYLLADQMTVPCVVELLTNGKRNGEFASWQEAYMEVSRLYELENRHPGEWSEDDIIRWEVKYDLVDIDGDDIPELAAGINGYFVSLYMYQDGTVYRVMDQWPYGAGGNSGYRYQPGENRFCNYDTDFAGLILYTTYMTINSQHTFESVTIKMINFDDRNGNEIPDGDEEDSAGEVCVLYVDGVKITEEEYASKYADWAAGEYESLRGSMSYEDLQSLLSSTDVWQP